MVIPETLGREISEYINNLIQKDAVVFDGQGKNVVFSNDPSIQDQKVALPLFGEIKSVRINNQSKIAIPLKYQQEIIGSLLLDDAAEIKSSIPLIKSFAELLIQQNFEKRQPALDHTDQFLNKIYDNFSQGELKNFEQEANALGYDTNVSRLAVVLHLKGFWDNCLLDYDQPSFERDEVIKNWKRNIENSLNSFFTKNADLIIGYIGNDRFLIYKAITEENEDATKKLLKKSYKSIFEPLKSRRIASVAVGFGNGYRGIEGLVKARREAELTLELGQKMWGENQSYYFGDLGILSIIGEGDRDKKLVFSDRMLGRLRNPELRKTLECFFERNLNLTETSEEMKIHRNTVIYRLNQITKALNADPRIFEQAMSIKIALMIKQLFG